MSRVRRASRVEARVEPFRWGWRESEAARVEAHWARRSAARPALFNGPVLMLHRLEEDGDGLRAGFFETDYAGLTAWLDLGRPDPEVANGFAMGALRAADGPFILGRMGVHTANAGQLYFPAGTPDPADVGEDGTVDLAGSLLRELGEETGFAPAELEVAPDWTVVETDGQAAFLRIVRLALPAEDACRRIRSFIGSQAEPELADVVAVPEAGPVEGEAMPGFLPVFLDHVRRGQI